MGMVVPFPEPERSWRASLLIFLVDCWSKKSASSSGSRGTVSSSIWALSRLLDLLSLRLPLAHLTQSIAPQSISCKNMQNSQLDKCCLEIKHPNKLWLYSFGDEYGCPLPWAWMVLTSLLADLLGGLLVEKIIIIRLETLHPHPSAPSPDFWTCSPCVSHWHTSPNPWPCNPLPAKICKTHKCCHENKHPNKPWFYSFGNEYGCPLLRAWTVLTSLLADLLGGLLVDKILINIGLKTVYPHPSGPSQLLDLLSLRLLMAHLTQSMAL